MSIEQAHLRTHWLGQLSPKPRLNADQAQYVRSSSGLISIVVMNLLMTAADDSVGWRQKLHIFSAKRQHTDKSQPRSVR